MKKSFSLISLAFFICATNIYALPPAAAGYGLAWSDEFTGTTLDKSSWVFDTGAWTPNHELEFYSEGNYTIENGSLVLWAKHESMGGRNYTSCRPTTAGLREFTYGYFEARVKTPKGNGLWPAVWLLGASINHGVAWPTCGEMELYEQRTGPQQYGGTAGDNCFIGTCHYGNGGGGPVYNSKQYNYTDCLCNNYHLYGILWDSAFVEYYFDDQVYWPRTATPSINQSINYDAFHNPFYWILNIAVGGDYQGGVIDNSIFPQKMYIDYVRVYQKGVGVANSDIKRLQTLRSFALVNPSTAQLKVYNLSGKLVADYTNKVRQMKAGDNAIKMMPATLSNGAYIVRLLDNGRTLSQRLVSAR